MGTLMDNARRRRHAFGAAALVATLVTTACGGGGGSKKTADTIGGDQTSTTESTVAPVTPSDQSTTSTSTATAVAGGSTATTAKKATTGTTAKKTTSVSSGTNKTVSGGITNVTSAPSTAPAADLQVGGTISYLRAADATTMDPVGIANSAGSDGVPGTAVYDVLVYTDTTDGQVKPQTADSLTSSDGQVWTLKVKPNIKFSDGTPYDAAAVKFNWLRLQDPANKANKAAQANLIGSMDVVDPLTLKLTLKARNAVFPQAVALIPFIGSPAAITANPNGFGNAPVGAGPFVVKSWTRDSQMVLVRNPGYWNAPRPYVDQVNLKIITDETQRVNTYKSGDGNLLYTVVASSASQMKAAGATEYATVLNGGNLLLFNTRKAPFSDIRLRQAVTAAIDRADYVKVVESGVIPVMDSIFRPDSPFYDKSILQPGYDPTKAQQLFDQLAAEAGGPVSFTLYTFNSATFPLGVQYIQGILNGYKNVKVQVQVESIAQNVTRVSTGDYGIDLFGNFFVDPEPGWSTLFTCGSAGNFTGYCSAKYDAAINDQKTTLDGNQRIADIKAAQQQFYADIPADYVERRVNWNYGAANVRDVTAINDGTVLLDRIWVKSR
jgi:peptide/nickel transport system substrate-binding protein